MGTELLVLEHTTTASLGELRPVLAEPGSAPWRLAHVPAGPVGQRRRQAGP